MKIAYALQNFKRSNGSSSVFPPLIGSHRKIKTDNYSHTPPSYKNMSPPIKQQQQINFLNRMKKARDIILSHQRRKKLEIDETNRFMQKLKNDNSYNFLTKDKRKSFSQVVYKIRQSNKKLPKNQSFDNQKYNDKILRQCKSQFMPNLKQKYKKNQYYINKKKQASQRNKTQNSNSNSNRIFGQNPERSNETKTKQKQKILSSQKYLLNVLINEQIMKSNGSELIQKLRKCLISKQKQKQNNQNLNCNIQKQNSNKQQQISQQQMDGGFENKIQFPYNQPKKQTKTQIKFFIQKKQKKKIKITLKKQEAQKQNEELQMQQQQTELNQDKFNIKLINQGNQQPNAVKNALKAKVISKSVHIDQNYKIQGWENKFSNQPQLYQ